MPQGVSRNVTVQLSRSGGTVAAVDDERAPVLVGVGQVRGNRERTLDGAREPLALIADAVRVAGADAAAEPLVAAADSVAAVGVLSWAYADLARAVAARVGARPADLVTTTLAGHWPARLVHRAAARIADGRSRVALVVGGEAMASAAALGRAGTDPVAHGWSADPGGGTRLEPADLGTPAMWAAGTTLPARVYPLFESALRHATDTPPEVSARDSARLYAAFTRVAAGNDAAWDPRERTPAEIGTVGPGNRMICEPYPLALVANPMVDQAAAVLVTSLAAAREHGVPEDRIVHVLGGAGADDDPDILRRPSFADAPGLADALDRCLAGRDPATLDVVDVYSCFPVVPKLVARHLGLPLDALAGVTGGHNAFGGPLASYTLHALVAAVARIRSGARTALVHANGGHLTRQHAVLLGRAPGPLAGDPEPRDVRSPGPRLVPVPDGEVVVEAATVEHDRAGEPAVGYLVGRVGADRVAASTAAGDRESARALSLWRDGAAREIVGTTLRVAPRDGHVVVRP